MSRIPIWLLLCVICGGALCGEEKPLSKSDLDKQVAGFLKGGAEREKALAALASGDEIKAKEVAPWAKSILDKARRIGPRLSPKPTNLLERLSGQQLDFAKMLVSTSPVAELETPTGKMRAIVIEAKDLSSVCVCLHGGGSSATHPGNLDNEMAWGLEQLHFKALPKLPFQLFPRCLDDKAINAWIKPEEAQAVDAMLDAFLRTYAVRPDRVFIFGESMGGYGAWHFAALLADRFAAIVDATGGCNRATTLQNLRNVPFAVFIGGQDTTRSPSAKEGIEALKALRAADPDGYESAYNEYPDMDHALKSKALADINAYLKDKVRRSYPRKVVWYPEVAWKRRFYNLAIAAPVLGQSVVAEMGQDNVVTVKSDKVQAMTVYLNDALANLDKEVQVVWNGEKVFTGRLPRRLTVMLETLADHCDSEMFFTAKVELTAK